MPPSPFTSSPGITERKIVARWPAPDGGTAAVPPRAAAVPRRTVAAPPRDAAAALPVVPQRYPQETVEQQTGQQETDPIDPLDGPPHKNDDQGREALRLTIADFSREFGDADHARANLTHATNLWRATGVPPDEFIQLLYDARADAALPGQTAARAAHRGQGRVLLRGADPAAHGAWPAPTGARSARRFDDSHRARWNGRNARGGTAMINRLLTLLTEELRDEGLPDPLGASFTLAALWDDLARLVGEIPPTADRGCRARGAPAAREAHARAARRTMARIGGAAQRPPQYAEELSPSHASVHPAGAWHDPTSTLAAVRGATSLRATPRSESGLKNPVRNTHACLRRALQQAVDWNLTSRNVAALVAAPRVGREEVIALAPDQVRQLQTAARPGRWAPLIAVALTTGLRMGEVLGLRWGTSISPSARSACSANTGRIAPSASRRARRGGVRSTSPHRAWRLLASIVGSRPRNGTSSAPTGRTTTWSSARTRGDRSASAMSSAHSRPCCCRSACPTCPSTPCVTPTLLLAQGVHPKVVQERLGHATIAMTLDVYSAYIPSMGRDC